MNVITRFSVLQAILALVVSHVARSNPLIPEWLDQPGQTFTASPAAAFTLGTGSAAKDGTDSLRMSRVHGSARLETTVQGPAVVSWWWRRTYDTTPADLRLFFLYDGNRLADHDDGQLWEKVSIQVPTGPHTLAWQVPDGALATSTSFAVLDGLTVTPNTVLPETTAMNDPGGVWLRTELGTQWQTTTSTTHDGISAAEARPTMRDQGTSLRRLVSGPAQLSWWWQLQGSDNNELKAKLRRIFPENTTLVSRWDLNSAAPWQRASFTVPPGLHVINWRYEFNSPTPTAAAATAAGQIDEFTSAPIGLQEALGLPNQVWTYGLAWEVAADSVDTATPGSIAPSTLHPGQEAWVESAFTGPVLLTWAERAVSPTVAQMRVYLDGVPGPWTFVSGWATRSLYVPNGLHTVRWAYQHTDDEPLQTPVRFDLPQPLPVLPTDQRNAMEFPSVSVFGKTNTPNTVVSTAPDGPAGPTALQITPGNSPYLLFDPQGLATPALVSYFYKTSGPGVFFERPDSFAIPSSSVWKKRSILVPTPRFLAWGIPDGAVLEVDGFQADAPPVDRTAWLARSGLSWTIAPGAVVIARNWDPSLPSPQGERLLVASSSSAGLQAVLPGPGVLRVKLQETGNFSHSMYAAVNGSSLPSRSVQNGDLVEIDFAASNTGSTINLVPLTNLSILSMHWMPGQPNSVSPLLKEGLDAAGMEIRLGASSTAVVENVPSSGPGDRRVVRLDPTFPPGEITTQLVGPGFLSFEWKEDAINNNTPPASVCTTAAGEEMARCQHQWSRVKLALPPGPVTLAWRNNSPAKLYLDRFQWQPTTLVPGPVPGVLGTAQRSSGGLWREVSAGSSEPILVAPFKDTVSPAVDLQVQGPGVFVIEARLLSSHNLPHFHYQHGLAFCTLSLDGAGLAGMDVSDAWRSMAVSVGAGQQTISLDVLGLNGYDGAIHFPATLQVRAASLQPSKTLAQLSNADITWGASLGAIISGAEAPTVHGPAAVLQLPSGENYVEATVVGPGLLAWGVSQKLNCQLFLNQGSVPVLLDTNTISNHRQPSHQLVLPAGTHRVRWDSSSASGGPFLIGESGRATLAVRWEVSARPMLTTAVGLSTETYTYFRSDGGWHPVPFSLANPQVRIQTAYPGPAAILRGPSTQPAASPLWGTDFAWQTDLENTAIVPLGGLGNGPWEAPSGERGTMLEPYPVIQLGNIIAQNALPAETLAAWSARQGLSGSPLADPDGDGLSWLLESALGLNPFFPETGTQQWSVSPTSMKARFPWPSTVPVGITRILDVSSDLTNWTPIVPTVVAGVAEVPVTPPYRFTRVRVTQP